MPLFNRYGLSEVVLEQGHAKGGLTLTSPPRDRQGIEEEAGRFQDDEGNPQFDRVLDISSAAIAVSHRADLPYLVKQLLEQGGEGGLHLAAPPLDGFQSPSVEGFSMLRLLQQYPNSGHIGELQIHTLDLLQARDLGIDGHLPAQLLHQQLLSLPAHSQQRSTTESQRWNLLWGQVRHLFVLALEAELRRVPRFETDEELLGETRRFIEGVRRRAIASGPLFDAQGNAVKRDVESSIADEFDILRWPRTYLCAEHGVLKQHSGEAPVVRFDTGQVPLSPQWHPANLIWCGLLAADET